MPYIISTKRPVQARDAHGVDAWDLKRAQSRRAVATLDEEELAIALFNWRAGDKLTDAERHIINAIRELPEQGGTVGPLPDGTVIEVERASWDDLVGPENWNANTPEAEVIAAYNTAQAPPAHDAAYHERYEAEHGRECPDCAPWAYNTAQEGGE